MRPIRATAMTVTLTIVAAALGIAAGKSTGLSSLLTGVATSHNRTTGAALACSQPNMRPTPLLEMDKRERKVLGLTSTSTSSSSHAASSPTAIGPTNTCASYYSGGRRITVQGTGTLPKPTSFIQKSASQGLFDSSTGALYRIAGINMYWLCQDENVPGVKAGAPTDKSRIREGLAIAVAMGCNTVRATSCGASTGNQFAIEPELNSFGNWDVHDYVIFSAREYGLRVTTTCLNWGT